MDFKTLLDQAVTVRDRDTMAQVHHWAFASRPCCCRGLCCCESKVAVLCALNFAAIAVGARAP